MVQEAAKDRQTLQRKALEVHRRLTAIYGQPSRPAVDPLEALILTILSQNTNDVNRDRAYFQLRQSFPTWEAILEASDEEVAQAIRTAGLANVKAPRIRAALRAIIDRTGRLDLSFICRMTRDEARQWLMSLEGIGPKTAAIVLLFACGHEAFPVDTHIYRVSRRIGLVPWKASREKAHEILEDLLPPETYYPFHINLIEHGRKICRAARPLCEDCALADLCDYYDSVGTAPTATAAPTSASRS